jgi:hypothetical protein
MPVSPFGGARVIPGVEASARRPAPLVFRRRPPKHKWASCTSSCTEARNAEITAKMLKTEPLENHAIRCSCEPQMRARCFFNPLVVGSIPTHPTIPRM